MFTSLALVYYLKNLTLNDAQTRLQTTLAGRLYQALSSFPLLARPSVFIGFITGLLGISGLPTVLLFISHSNSNVLKMYSSFNAANGAFLIGIGFLLTRYTHIKNIRPSVLNLGILCLLIATFGLISMVNFASEDMPLYVAFLCIGSTAVLLPLHQLTIEEFPADLAATIRSSMALFLTLVFGVSEMISAYLISAGFFNHVMIFKALMCVASGLLLGVKKWEKSLV
jgi:hypothetical protein